MMKFDEVKKGYNKEQVDAYIKTVSDEYQKLLEEHKELEQKVNEDKSYSEAIASALIKAELSGEQIIAAAKEEARRISVEANYEVESLKMEMNKELEAIKNEKELALAEMRSLSRRIQAVLGMGEEHEAQG